jgi:hypothetical protein
MAAEAAAARDRAHLRIAELETGDETPVKLKEYKPLFTDSPIFEAVEQVVREISRADLKAVLAPWQWKKIKPLGEPDANGVPAEQADAAFDVYKACNIARNVLKVEDKGDILFPMEKMEWARYRLHKDQAGYDIEAEK